MGRPLDWIIGLQCKARIDASGALHHIIEHFSRSPVSGPVEGNPCCWANISRRGGK